MLISLFLESSTICYCMNFYLALRVGSIHTLMLVEFKLGREMFIYLYCGWYEVKRKERLEKERKKRKALKKKNKKSRNNVMLISEVCLVWNLWWIISLIEIILFGTLWVDHSLRFRQVFVSISFRTYHLFVNQATLQPWKALVILAFVFSIEFLDECII